MYGSCKALAAIIEQGVESGEFRPVDPRFLFLVMVGACSYAMAERALFGELLEKSRRRRTSRVTAILYQNYSCMG